MLRLLTTLGAALGAAALAVAVPVTGHAVVVNGPCSGAGTGHPVQHTGTGHTSFSDSHNNCVQFNNPGNTAFLDESNNNSIVFYGTNNTVEDFRNSNNNFIIFDTGSSGNELNADHANNWGTVEVTAQAVNDFIDLVGTPSSAVDIVIQASNAALEFTSGCVGFHQVGTAFNGMGTEKNPIIIC